MSEKDSIMKGTDAVPATIASGSTTSDVISLGGMRLFAVGYPASMTGSTLAVKTGLSSDSLKPLRDQTGNQVTIPVAAGENVNCDPQLFHGWKFVQFVSSSTEAAARALTLNLSTY